MRIKRIVKLITLLAVIPALSGCWYAAAAGAGAYGGDKNEGEGLHGPESGCQGKER